MFPKQNLERKLNVQIATSGVMDNAISLWLQMYENKPPWMGGEADTRTMNLPAAIAEEFSRLILTEFEFKLEGSARADFSLRVKNRAPALHRHPFTINDY